ncbi:MAG: LysR substrate-binding domain-containing protein [Candidatus Devosia phytovorans]|uniref:LysR substrate-binding domain-containing protein n=1 Tax=Candidatus Devosia phytovorans TaxID=3121372 RepID=A0AAJ6B109_9HYPH|nr:LysR substrate-binding domain-containing protein [Devosia sp.]WEK05286.1 MAG: LysR substrate-binding domain-containing protein [Devosia sp.]
MRRRVPLNAVRAFEAAARYKSLVRAADELCVTPTAVSHQIRLLEDFLQTKLFLRKNSRLELTADSRACLGKLTNALDLIDEALMSLKEPEDVRQRLMVGASASVASHWLLPRMSKFVGEAPDIDVTITTFIRRQEIENEGADLWICNWQTAIDRRIEPLMEEEIVPVCAPELAARYGNNPSDILRAVPLIHIDRREVDQNGPYPDWGRYLREFGISRNDIVKGPRFNQASPSIEAAKIGLGAILGRSLLIEEALASGTLVQIGEAYPIRSPYFIVSPWAPTAPGIVNRFKDWLYDQVAQPMATGAVVPA